MVPTLIRCISLAMVLLLSSVRTPFSPSKWRSARRTKSTSSGVPFYFTLFYVLGTDAKFSEVTSVQPVYDSLGDDCLAMSYFLTSGSIDIYTSVACMHDIDNDDFGVTIMATADYSPDYTYHAVTGKILSSLFHRIGLSKNKYILAHAGTWPPEKLDKIFFVLATYENNNITFSEPIAYELHGSKGFFDLDQYVEVLRCDCLVSMMKSLCALLLKKLNMEPLPLLLLNTTRYVNGG